LKNKRIAILGAGGLGACLDLELEARGYQIDLFEEHTESVRKASFVNEGKIHLGFIYAMDKTFHTARQMIDSAIHFIPNLKRWIDFNTEELISTPFHYLVHKGSLQDGDQLDHHYQKCIAYFQEAKQHYKKDYLGLYDQIEARKLTKGEWGDVANPEFFDDVFLTNERSLEPRAIAYKLSQALIDSPKINLRLNTKVLSVSEKQNILSVKYSKDGIVEEDSYDIVVNSTWSSLLEIDRTMGMEPLSSWSFRYKFGNKILVPISGDLFYSCTMVQGPYGDVVNFKDKGGFFSWYPIGRTGWSEDHQSPNWDQMYPHEERQDIFFKSFEQLKMRIPSLENVQFQTEDVDPAGGVIFALGNTDVDNQESKLPTRHEVGIRSLGNYHSVKTGKYTMIPHLALKIADRITDSD
jgi:hypothetical protein